MHSAIISTVSLLLQLAAAIQALRLIRPSGRMLGWVLIAAAAVFQALRRAETLYRMWRHGTQCVDATSEYLGLAVSLFLLVGVMLIGQMFRDLKEAHDTVRESKVKLEALNASLETRIREEVAKNREKDVMVIQQGRLASMGEMMRSITHQWRQPLNNLGLILQSLPVTVKHDETEAQEVRESVKLSMGIIEFMSHTIDDFRNFFKEERQKSEFVVMDVVRRVEVMVSASLYDKDISMAIKGGNDVRVLGYPNEIAHVLLNLINNARDVLVERRVTQPSISVCSYGQDGKAIITVTDNGGGIAEEHLEKVFDPDFTTKESEQGTGLGLYLSRVMVERHMGGRLTVRNSENGAEFRIEI